jgi:hypothetical protein
VLKKFLRSAQNKLDVKVKKIRSDNGTEFKNTHVEDFLDEEGIKHEFLALILLKKMGWPKERIIFSLRWQELYLMNTRPQTSFGQRQSTWCVMQLTASISTSS